MFSVAALLLLICGFLPWTAPAMRADHLARLRQGTVDMFYHGYSNYMKHAFPEDEVSCAQPPSSSLGPFPKLTRLAVATSHVRTAISRPTKPRAYRPQ
jgi:hypothetical protein